MRRTPPLAWLTFVLVVGCGDLGGLGGLDVLGTDTGISPVNPVFLCQLSAADLQLEFCWRENDAESFASLVADQCDDMVTCGPSPRVPGGIYHCTGTPGCNALEGCWCPGKHTLCVPALH